MIVRFWGVRGLSAAPGKPFVRYGGNTTAVEVVADSGARLLIDCGTGAIPYGRHLLGHGFAQGRGHLPVLLSSTQLDHISALPFFVPVFIPGNRIEVLGMAPAGETLLQILQDLLNPHYCPINSLDNLPADIRVQDVRERPVAVDGFEVEGLWVPGPRLGATAWRVRADGRTLVFVCDVEYGEAGPAPALVELVRGADLLIHDATWPDEAYPRRKGAGNAPVRDALRLAELAGAGRLVLFHHAPDATDERIDAMLAGVRTRTQRAVEAAAEGGELAV